MRRLSEGLHPTVLFTYLFSVIVFSMIFRHPLFLITALFFSFIYSVWIKGLRGIRFNLLCAIPIFLLSAVINPLFNRSGETVLFHLGKSAITAEALLYGLVSGGIFMCAVFWISVYGGVMTSDKVSCVFGRVFPRTVLMFSMILRLVPEYLSQLKKRSELRKMTGKKENIRSGAETLSCMMSDAVEKSLTTVMSMQSRGYGLKGKTSYSRYVFTARDAIYIAIILMLDALTVIVAAYGLCGAEFFPRITLSYVGFGIIPYAVLCALPLIEFVKEELKWSILKSKI